MPKKRRRTKKERKDSRTRQIKGPQKAVDSAETTTATAFRSEILVFTVFAVFAVLYAVFIPSFEGPDESEHCRYIQAYTEGAEVHPVDPKALYRWGYQVHHPPLYYWLVGQYAKLIQAKFHGRLTVNMWQNPRYPFIRHDLPGHRFPFMGEHVGLRLLRLPSVLFGILTFLIVCFTFRNLFPDDPAGRCFLLTTAMLVPNSLQQCSIVANDGLSLLFSVTALYFALKIIQEQKASPWAFLLTGLFVGLGMTTKLTTFITLATVGTLWTLDALSNRRLRYYMIGILWFLFPVLLLTGPYFYSNVVMYQDPTRERLLKVLTPAFYHETPRSVLYILNRMAIRLPPRFLADLCWHSIRIEGLSQYLFWPWLAGAVLSIGFIRHRQGKSLVLSPQRLISIVAICWSIVFLILANRHWTILQIRYWWCVYPFTLISLLFALRSMPIRYWRWRWILCAGALLFAIGVNVHVLLKFREFYRPSLSQEDRDYETYLYNYSNNRKRGAMYVRFGEFEGIKRFGGSEPSSVPSSRP